MLMLGGSGGRTKGGRNLGYLNNTNRLFLSMMNRMNVTPKTFAAMLVPLDEV